MTSNYQLFRKLSTIIVIAFSCIAACWATALAFTEVTPGTRAAFQIRKTTGQASGPEILSTLERISAEHNARISTFSTSEDSGELVLYSTEHSSPHRGVFPGQNIEVRPLTQVPHNEPRAMYLLEGSSEFHTTVSNEMQKLGATGEFYEVREWAFLLGDTDLGKFILLGVAAVVIVVFIGVFSQRKGVGIRRLLGNSTARMVADMLLMPALWTALTLSLVVAVLAATRGLDLALQCGRYLFIAGFMYLSIAVATAFSTVLLLHLTKVMPSISGKLAMPPVLTLTAIIRVLLVGVCLSWCAASVGYHREFQIQQGEAALWKHQRTSYLTRITGARDWETRMDLQTDLATHLRRLSTQQRVLLHSNPGATNIDNPGQTYPAMIYNRTAAKASLPAEIQEIGATVPENSVLLITPPNRSDLDQYRDQLVPACADNPERCLSHNAPGDFTAFTWQANEYIFKARSEVTNPIVVILPDDLYGIDDRNLTAQLSVGNVSFTDTDAIHEITDNDERFTTYFSEVSPLRQVWMSGHESLRIARNMAMVGAGLSIALVAVFGLFYGMLLTLGYGQRARAYRIFGIPAWAFYRKVLLWDAVVLLGGAWVLWQQTATYRMLTTGEVSSASEDLLNAVYVNPLAVWLTALAMVTATGLSVWTISRKLSC